jgi:hypothetical protein
MFGMETTLIIFAPIIHLKNQEMKPNKAFDLQRDTEKEPIKDAKKEKSSTVTPNASDIQEQTGNRSGNFYRVAHAGPFIRATNNPADGFMFDRPGFPVQVFHAKGRKGAMIQAREHATKNLKAIPLNWRKTIAA